MNRPSIAFVISALALVIGCSKEPSGDPRSLSSAAKVSSEAKATLFKNFVLLQTNAGGLYSLSNGFLQVGDHSIDINPIVESQNSQEGKRILALRMEVTIDGIQRSDAVFGAIGVGDDVPGAIIAALGEWYVQLAMPLFQAIGGRAPSFTTADHDVFTGALGLRGTGAINWVDGSEAMNRKVLEAALSASAPKTDFLFLDLNVMVPASGKPEGECRLNGTVSDAITTRLTALDWPRAAGNYMFKQVFILKRKKV